MKRNNAAANVFNKCAIQYQDKFMNVDLYKDSFDLFCNNITQRKAAILDIACGPGNITKHLLNKRPDFNILGIDLAPNMIELARINNPSAKFEVMDCRDISKLNTKFDAIMCGFCLPYISKEETVQLITDASSLLKPKGIFYISTMEDDYEKSGLKKSSSGEHEVYMYYHRADYLSKTLLSNGLTIQYLTRQGYPGPDNTQSTDLIIIAKK